MELSKKEVWSIPQVRTAAEGS